MDTTSCQRDGGALGPKVVGIRRHGEVRRGHQKEEEVVANLMCALAAEGHDWVVGGEEEGDNVIELTAANELQRSLGDGSRCTNTGQRNR